MTFETQSYLTQNMCFDFLYDICLKHFSFYELRFTLTVLSTLKEAGKQDRVQHLHNQTQLSKLGRHQRYQQYCRYIFPSTQQGVPADCLLTAPFTPTCRVHIERTCCLSYLQFHHFLRGISTCFVGTLAKLRKANYHLRNVCLSVRVKQFDAHWTDF